MKTLLKFVWPCNILKWRWNFHEENDEVVVMREMNQGSGSSEKEIDKAIMLRGKLSWE